MRKHLEQRRLVEEWQERLVLPCAGARTVEVIGSVLKDWLKRRRRGPITFRLTQVLTGHDYISKYLHTVARREEVT